MLEFLIMSLKCVGYIFTDKTSYSQSVVLISYN